MNIKIRLGFLAIIFAFGLTFVILSLSAFLLKDVFVALDVQRLSNFGSSQTPVSVDVSQLQGLGVEASVLDKFVKSDETSIGIVDPGFLADTLYYIYKHEKGYAYTAEKSGLFVFFKEAYQKVFYIAMFAAFFAAILIWLLMSYAFAPLRFLRLKIEDLAAGRPLGSYSYNFEDEIGSSLRALKQMSQDIERKDQALSSVSELATTDGMTRLKNYRAFKEEFEKLIAMSKRNQKSFCVILLDVDHFKKFNDTYGHQQGDEVLRVVAKVLTATSRKTDFVARYGGEEFVVLLPETPADGGAILAEKLRKNLEDAKVQDINQKQSLLSVTGSFGLVHVNPLLFKTIDVAASIMEQCDSNLYKAKKAGRNKVIGSDWIAS